MNKTSHVIMNELNNKFINNFKEWSSSEKMELDKIFIYLKCLAAIGEILQNNTTLKHRYMCCSIYDEIFSDGVSAIYLAANAMNKPAKIILRRIFEMGIASIYLWDMPHLAHSWSDHDYDLSFTEMLKHINSKGYLLYVSVENNMPLELNIFPTEECQKIYGVLSDIVHGKVTTFESALPNRFKFTNDEWEKFANQAIQVLEILIKGYLKRFPISEELYKLVPLSKRELC
ncbi:MAG: hypothetical protein Q8S36_05930 [Sulfuricurvum sp.]|nr:hypothetical protein [Sulfuricurvum sp.]